MRHNGLDEGQAQHGICSSGRGLEGEVNAQDSLFLTFKPSAGSALGAVIS